MTDHDRPLNKRGRADAPKVGRILAEQNLIPDAILCSTAQRTRSTAEAIIAETGFDGQLVLTESLYCTGHDAAIDLLAGLPNSVTRAMVVGHNPSLEMLLELLTGEWEVLPTAALAHVQFPIDDWSALTTRTRGTLIELWRPRDRDSGEP